MKCRPGSEMTRMICVLDASETGGQLYGAQSVFLLLIVIIDVLAFGDFKSRQHIA